MKKFFVCVMVCAGTALFAGENALFSMFSPQDEIFEDIRFLAGECASPTLSFTPPLSRDEVQNFLDNINVENIAPEALAAYNRIKGHLTPPVRLSYKCFALGVNVIAGLKTYTQTNADIPFTIRIENKFRFLKFL